MHMLHSQRRAPSLRRILADLAVAVVRPRRLAVLACLLLALDHSPLSAEDRTDWVIEQISSHNAGMSPARRTEKYAEMGETLFKFYRATNYLFWVDHASSAQLTTFGGNKETRIWLHG